MSIICVRYYATASKLTSLRTKKIFHVGIELEIGATFFEEIYVPRGSVLAQHTCTINSNSR